MIAKSGSTAAFLFASIALVTWLGTAHAETIEDPENPAFTPPDDSDHDSEGSGVESILDPENSEGETIWDPENPGVESIMDPENPGGESVENSDNSQGSGDSPEVAPQTSSRPTTLGPTIFRGEWLAASAFDTRRDIPEEDTFEHLEQLTLRIRHPISDRWRVTAEGRLSWWVTSGWAPRSAGIVPHPDQWQGRVEPELRDTFVSGRAGSWLLRFGNVSYSWGSTDITRPADVLNPTDFRRGVFADRDDTKIPVPAADATLISGAFAWQLVAIPFFVPHRAGVYGSDYALLRPGSPLGDSLPAGAVNQVLDPSVEDLVQPLVIQTELPEELPRNASLGTRLTANLRGADISAGYFFGFDRTPFTEASDSFNDLLAALGAQELPSVEVTPELLGAIGSIQADIENDQTVYRSRYRRLHTFEVDGATYLGPVGVRFDLVYQPERTLPGPDFNSIRRPVLSGALGFSYENGTGDFVWTLEAFGTYALLENDDSVLLAQDEVGGLASVLQLDMSAFAGVGEDGIGRLSIQTGAFYIATGGDLFGVCGLGWDVSEASDLSVLGTLFTSFDSDRETIGDLLEPNDAVIAEWTTSF